MKTINRKDYYKTKVLIIQYNHNTDTYFIRNRIGLIDSRLAKEQFDSLNAVKIKKIEYDTLVNKYYNNTEDEWIYNNVKYKKINNFSQQDWYNKIPKHTLGEHWYWYFKVYHLGKVYYCLPNYGGMGRSCLYDVNTLKQCKWTALKHCQPIFNITENKFE